MNKIIFHLDINYFFARVEEIENNNLENIPFVIGNKNSRSVISTSNPIARNLGIKSGMKINNVLSLCPDIICIPPQMELYKKYSNRFFKSIKEFYTDEIEIASIDECYLDATFLVKKYHNSPEILATNIINKIFKETKLKINIGIGNNKFLSKMASDFKSSSGVDSLFIKDINKKLLPLPINRMYNIGKVSASFLKSLKIDTIRDFIDYEDKITLKKYFGKTYNTLISSINGTSSSYIDFYNYENKSISSTHTFRINTDNNKAIIKTIEKLNKNIFESLSNKNLTGFTYSINIKKNYKINSTKSITIKNSLNNINDIYNIFYKLFFEQWEGEEIRSITLKITNIKKNNEIVYQPSLFK